MCRGASFCAHVHSFLPSLSLSFHLCVSMFVSMRVLCVCVCVLHSRVVGSRQDPIDGATGVVGRG